VRSTALSSVPQRGAPRFDGITGATAAKQNQFFGKLFFVTQTLDHRPRRSPLAWGIFLATSWTWCIGMFLPVLLVRDYGLGAWFVFAIPNVVGAAAMGWVLARPGASERVLARHRAACVAFTIVTLSFHLFFLVWLSHSGIIPLAWAVSAVVVGTALGLLGRGRVRIDLLWAAVTLVISVVVLGRGLWGITITSGWGRAAESPTVALPPLALVSMLGFLLCPYLDLTFHRAASATAARGTSRVAFGAGFGVVFLAMIFLTLLYAGDFHDSAGGADHLGSFGRAGLISWVALHMVVQIGFTWGGHLRALPPVRASDAGLWMGGAIMAGAGIFFTAQQTFFDHGTIHMQTGELVYRLFLGFYGLVFPAYVWITMAPVRRWAPGPTRRAVWVWAFAVIAAAPAFWLAFVAGHMRWLVPGVGAVLAARGLVGREEVGGRPAEAGQLQ
jgi:hypothetical protein